jgi:glutathione peroxidase
LTSPLDAIAVTTIDGRQERFGAYAGKARLVVNVASKCGFTPQYAGLEALHRKYRERGLVVLGFPCDQFGHQEPGDQAAIRAFCTSEYDVSFPLFAKIEVNGANAHPLYRALKNMARGLFWTKSIKWNFTKFLISRDGTIVKRYGPSVKPEAIAGDIEKALR